MSDSEEFEIDIEEHDILDNPAIKRIFPDLSVIKKEINQYYDEVYNTSAETTEDLCKGDAITTKPEAQLPNIFQNSKGLVNSSPFCISKGTAPLADLHQGDAITTESEAQLPNDFQNSNECITLSSFATSEDTAPLEDLCKGDAITTEPAAQLPNDFQNSNECITLSSFATSEDTAPLEDLCKGDAITTEPAGQLPNDFQNSNDCITLSSFATSEDSETQASRYLHDNLIILGSKPNLVFQEITDSSVRKEPKLIINNINSFLNSCKRYCKECLILFPRAHSFNLHKISIHFQINNQVTFMGSKVRDNLFKCNVCDRFLSSRCNLLRHFRNLHRGVKALNTVDSSDYKIGVNVVSQTKESTGGACFHCQQLFPTHSSLIEHLYEVLEIKEIGPSDRSTSSADTKEPNEDNLSDQLKEDEFVDESNVSYKNELVSSCPSSSSQVNTDSCDVDEHTLSQAIQLRRRSLRSVVRLAEWGDDNIKKKRLTANSDPLQDEHGNARKRLKMLEFKEQLNTKKTLKYHIRSRTEKSKNKKKRSAEKEKSDFKYYKKPSLSMFYKCLICSKYSVTFDCFSRHVINDHRVKKVPEVSKVPFDSQCKFCSSTTAGINSYNVHLFKYHKKQLKEAYFPMEELPDNKHHERVDQKIHFALKSILYKCMQCDLFFLSSRAAIDHSKHLGISDTWKCPFCQRIFTTESMALHKKQHSFSQSFTVHALAEAAFGRVLYKCSNCTVHYSEENFLFHYPKCDTETPNSLYCKVCDILINRDDMECHLGTHKEKKIQCCDFIIIESDMIDDKHTSKNTTKTKNHKSDTIDSKRVSTSKTKNFFKTRFTVNNKRLKNTKLAMSFCHTCKCFIYNVNLRKLHVQGKCGHMLKYACKDCGLMLTAKTHETHKYYHKKEQISLHDFIFYDLKTEKRICPPIPDYPKCNSCGIHFLRNGDLRPHSCQEQDFITCNVCSMKLTEQAYKLHVNFHSYSIPSVITKLEEITLPANPANEISCVEPNSSVSDDSFITNVMFSYTCKSCRLTVNTYDKVVQHCQDHYDSKVVLSNIQKCQNCNLTLLTSDYKNHNMLHLNRTFKMDSVKVIEFDPFYFRYNNDFWMNHIFAYLTNEEIRQILRNSIYRYECRLKMEKNQSGWSNSVLYRCDKCKVFIDPQSLYLHAANTAGKSCAKMRKHPCSLCGLNFVSLAYRTAHEKEHENVNVNFKSYKVVLYNKEQHETYNKIIFDANKRNVLYQCRNCDRAVDKFERNAHICDENNLKMCSICGLLLDKQHFDLHSIRHEELDKFNVQNMIVVMFGKPKLCNQKGSLSSSFRGTKLDYIMYRCNKCDISVRSKECISEHVCVLDNSKFKCSKCGLYFTKLDIKCHYKVHEINLDFDDLNMNVITFDASSKIPHVDSKELEENNDLVKKTESSSISPFKHEIAYKCNCGLHFFEELNAQQHANICNARMKISKQSCIKCDLLLTPGELFNHLLKHHSDKTLQYKYNIILVSKKGKTKSQV